MQEKYDKYNKINDCPIIVRKLKFAILLWEGSQSNFWSKNRHNTQSSVIFIHPLPATQNTGNIFICLNELADFGISFNLSSIRDVLGTPLCHKRNRGATRTFF